MEEWKDIKGYEGIYQISNLGRVKSVERQVINHRCGATRIIKEQFLTPTDNGKGYKIVCLRSNRTRKNKYLHRLVAEHFIENPCNKQVVNHLDFDKSNNAVTNLEWCSQLENITYSLDHMRRPKSKSQPTNTGEKYITKRIEHGKHIRYRVHIGRKGICRTFKTLEEAIQYRNGVI